jgi:hypothetical protein
MKDKKSIVITLFFASAITVLILAICLNLAWFGLYEFVREKLSLSYFRASCLISGILWFFVMVRNTPKMLETLEGDK